MNKRWLLNGALALLLIALSVIALNETGDQTPKVILKLTPLSATQVTHITVVRPTFTDVNVQRKGERWEVIRTPIAPGQASAPVPGNAFRIDSLARLAQADSILQLHPNSAGLTQYGLAPSPVTVRLNNIDIAFGGTDPIKGLRYVRVGDTVHAVADDQFSQAMAGFHEFVSTELMPDQPVIQTLKLPNLTVTRTTSGAWKAEPQPVDYSADAVTRLVDEWRYAHALSVGPRDAGPPQGQITIDFKDGGHMNFDIAAFTPQLLLVNNTLGLTYTFAADVGARLFDLSKHRLSE